MKFLKLKKEEMKNILFHKNNFKISYKIYDNRKENLIKIYASYSILKWNKI